MSTEILIYALPVNETERYTEVLLSTQCKNQTEIDALVKRATVDGFHSFRIANFTVGTKPNFNVAN